MIDNNINDKSEELLMIKEMLQDKCHKLVNCQQKIDQQCEEIKSLSDLVNSLKENNQVLSETFKQYKQLSQDQQHELEMKLANLSVERAEQDYQLDIMHQELRQIKKAYKDKDLHIQELENRLRQQESPDNLSVQSDDFTAMKKHRQSEEVRSSNNNNNNNNNNEESKQMQTQKIFQKRGSSKNKKQDIQMIMENLPTSQYSIMYEEELNKIKDTSNKKFEMIIWEKEVMSLFIEKKKNKKKIYDKLQQYLRNSYPEQFRGKIWCYLVGNKLQIQESLYEKLLQSIPSHPLVTHELLNLINNDLQRTFNIINDFQDSERLKDELRELLIIFSIYRPDIGYIQGMTYLAFMFLLRMSKQKAFKCFCNLLLSSNLLRSFYEFKQQQMDAYFLVFDMYLSEKAPLIYKYFENSGIPKQSFLVEWFYTVFARAFHLVLSSMVWDYFLYEGDCFLFKLALAILKLHEQELIKLDFEDILKELREKAIQTEGTQLFKIVNKLNIDNQSLESRLLSVGL